jgi:hypothetical protein
MTTAKLKLMPFGVQYDLQNQGRRIRIGSSRPYRYPGGITMLSSKNICDLLTNTRAVLDIISNYQRGFAIRRYQWWIGGLDRSPRRPARRLSVRRNTTSKTPLTLPSVSFFCVTPPSQIKDTYGQNCPSQCICSGSWCLPADRESSSKLGMTPKTKQSRVQSVSDVGSNEKNHLPKLPEPSSRAVGCSRQRKRSHPRRCSPSGQR